MKRVRRLLWVILIGLAGVAVGGGWWLHSPLPLRAPLLDLRIEPGTSPRGVAQAAHNAGVQTSPALLYWWFRLSGQGQKLQAGSYELERGLTPRDLVRKLARGEQAVRRLTLVDGWSFRQVREALAKADQLRPDTQAMTPEQIMQALGRAKVSPEGRFFPDTYVYPKGASDLAVLRRALEAMDRHLADAWALRASDTPLKTPEQALVLASIVEKETGMASDRATIAGVFSNRLRIGMALQTDPTVIFGLGEAFDGNLRRRDLRADTPWNTYTRAGLPPTPIAIPGKASLLAAVQPAQTRAIYFVARWDGSSHFSATLDEHNRAVNRYQRGGR